MTKEVDIKDKLANYIKFIKKIAALTKIKGVTRVVADAAPISDKSVLGFFVSLRFVVPDDSSFLRQEGNNTFLFNWKRIVGKNIESILDFDIYVEAVGVMSESDYNNSKRVSESKLKMKSKKSNGLKNDKQENQIKLIKKFISLSKPEGVSHVVVNVSPYYGDNEFKVSLNFIIPDDSDIDQDGFGKLIPSIEKNVEDVLGVRIYILSFGSTIESFYNRNKFIFESKLRTESKKEILTNQIKKFISKMRFKGIDDIFVDVEPVSNDAYYLSVVYLVSEDNNMYKYKSDEHREIYKDILIRTLNDKITENIEDAFSISVFVKKSDFKY